MLRAGFLAFLLFSSPITAISRADGHQPSSPQLVAQFEGRVLDATGGPLTGARLTFSPSAPGSHAGPVTTITDLHGSFSVSLLAVAYLVRIEADGFTEFSQQLNGALVLAGRRDFVLRIAGLHEKVTVTANAGYDVAATRSATKTMTPLRDVPQSVTVITKELVKDQLMTGMRDVVTYVPGITAHQGENNRDDLVIRGNRSSADFFVDGVRDDVQYFRDLYNLDRVEALKGPNAMVFGRGGGGGVVNRVLKQAGFQPVRAASLQAGAYENKRATIDLGQPLSSTVALRINSMFEDSGSFRDGVVLRRAGVNPTLTFAPDARTTVTASYEYLHDARTADRGITSLHGRPATVDRGTFYGRQDDSRVRLGVQIGSALVERRLGNLTVRNRTTVGAYDRFYQNFVPGAVTSDGTQVAITAYSNASARTNIFNQTDVSYAVSTGPLRHLVLAGFEAGRQSTDNFRQTGFFNNATSSVLVPFAAPATSVPLTFRQGATDADNHVRAAVTAMFVQDQLELTKRLQLVGGVRLDRFDLRYHNNRNANTLARVDALISPRAGLVFKPQASLSLYGSYSVSSLPSSGDQFSSLTAITQQLKPEHFRNVEIGTKWDARPSLGMTAAVYRVDRTNTRSTDPNDPTRIVQTGSQRTNGVEVGVNGAIIPAWRAAGGYAYQDGFVTSATANARAGAQVGQVPHHTFSLWNQYRVHPRLAGGVGVIHRSDMFAAIDNSVILPGYTRIDGAIYFTVTKSLRLQANVENLLDRRYFINADSNTNISPGAPRALRVALSAAF